MYEDLTPTERAAVLVRLLMLGWKPTTVDVALKYCLSEHGAYQLLARLSRVTPLAKIGKRWVMFLDGDEM